MNFLKLSLFCDAFGLGTAVSGAAQAGANILTTSMTNESNERNVDETNKANISMNNATNQANRDIADATNATNMAINQANIDYQNAYNQQVFERADTAFQRSARDASAVGINPLSLSGSVAGGDVAGSSSAPQASLGAQTGASMQSPQLKAFQAIAPQVAGLSTIFSELQRLQTGSAQRDLLREQAQRMKNENEFFKENGYYPSNMSDFEKFATVISNAFYGRGNAGKVTTDLKNMSLDLLGVPGTPDARIKSQVLANDSSKHAIEELNKDIEKAATDTTGNFIIRGFRGAKSWLDRQIRNSAGKAEYNRTLQRGYVIGY